VPGTTDEVRDGALMNSDRAKNVKQVQLPSGKVIEVMLFSEEQSAAAAAAAGAQPALPPPTPSVAPAGQTHVEDLHTCPRCTGELVYPVDWAEAGPDHWQVTLRCPECEWVDSGTFTQRTVERFDIELDHGAEALLRDLQQLAHANMAEDIERFVDALERDLIIPADF
jgi:hypothetical protein